MLSRPLLRLGVVCFLAGLTVVRAATTRDLPPGAVRVTKSSVIDQQGFGQPMTALTLFTPVGWATSGNMVWDQTRRACGLASTRVEWRAVAPGGLSAIELLPEESWSGNNLGLPQMEGACPNIRFTHIKEFLGWYAGRARPGSRILDYRDRSDIIANPSLYNRNDKTMAGELRMWAEAGEVLLAYQINGQEVREALSLMAIFNLTRMAGVMPGEIREFLSISTGIGVAIRAPSGQLDFNHAEMMRRSIKVDPQWSALMAEHNNKMMAINAKGESDRHAIRMKTAAEIAEINRQGYENRQASLDKSNAAFTQQVIRGMDNYVDPSTRERVELPNTHDHVWRLNDGSYLLTNDVNFQPNRDLGIQGRQLEVAR